MSITLVVSVVLMLGGLWGAAASDFQVLEKSLHRGKSLLANADARHTMRTQPHQQVKSEIRRSLGIEHINVHVTPATTKFNLPTIIKLYPPTAQPVHLRANMPLRFGRDDETSNLPQRFGRFREALGGYAKCPRVRETTNSALPQRFGRNLPNWSLLRALARAQLINTDLHWSEDLDFTSSSEENLKMREKTFEG